MITLQQTYLSEIVNVFKIQWPANRTIHVVCHGHSVPSGYFKTPIVDTFNAYPHLLHQGLKHRYPYAVVNVIVTAIGGENSLKGAARFEKDVLSHKPDVVTIDYALNDGPDAASVRANWVSMIEAAQAKNIKVILLTPTGRTKANLDDPTDPLNQHSAQIRGLAKTYQVGLVDSLAFYTQHVKEGGAQTDLLSQENHPNRKGHDLVANGLLEWFPDSVN